MCHALHLSGPVFTGVFAGICLCLFDRVIFEFPDCFISFCLFWFLFCFDIHIVNLNLLDVSLATFPPPLVGFELSRSLHTSAMTITSLRDMRHMENGIVTAYFWPVSFVMIPSTATDSVSFVRIPNTVPVRT